MSFTHAQQMALKHPCLFAFETMNMRLAHWLSPALKLVLSINTGYE